MRSRSCASLAIREARLGKDDPNVAWTLMNLGTVCHRLRRHQESEVCFRRALEIRETRLGKNHDLVAETLQHLGKLYTDMIRYPEAEALLRRALAIREKSAGKDSPRLTVLLDRLGGLYQEMGRLPEAEVQRRRCLAICEASLSKDHHELVAALKQPGSAPGRHVKLHRGRGLAAAQPGDHREPPETERPRHRHRPDQPGRSLSDDGRVAEAETLLRRSLAIREAVFGKKDLRTASAENAVAGLYQGLGRFDEAEARYRRSLKVLEATLGKDHPDVANVLNNLATLYTDTHRPDQALPLAGAAWRSANGISARTASRSSAT